MAAGGSGGPEEKDAAAGQRGSCLCGGVVYRIRGPMRDVIECHCTACRKTTGHYLAATQAWTDDFELESADSLRWYASGPESRRGFCERCGATLFFEFTGSGKISIAAGTLDGATGLRTAFGIYADDKGDYYDLPDRHHFPAASDNRAPLPPREG
ncbi:MAG: GFA family protein [Rhodospirillaceae bacterium]|nr:GFA family protein [Rhodospirillaceae bacterium]